MAARRRVVVDNNVLISGLLFPHSTPGRPVYKAADLLSLRTFQDVAILTADAYTGR